MTSEKSNLYRRFLKEHFNDLPPQVQALHDSSQQRRWVGQARVTGGKSPLAKFIRFVIGLPPAAEQVEISVTFLPDANGELWTRNFGGKQFSSYQLCGQGQNKGLLVEKFGPVAVALKIEVANGRLSINTQKWQFWRIPLPASLRPYGDSFESEVDGCFHFDVTMKMPLVGLIASYQGWLLPEQSPTGEQPQL